MYSKKTLSKFNIMFSSINIISLINSEYYSKFKKNNYHFFGINTNRFKMLRARYAYNTHIISTVFLNLYSIYYYTIAFF